MIYKTELVMFQNGKIRMVDVPEEAVAADWKKNILGLIYKYGQNDIQVVKGCCSLSPGDLIHLDFIDTEGHFATPQIWKIKNIGWELITEEEAARWRDSTVQVRLTMLLK
jgi:hypothetical protein